MTVQSRTPLSPRERTELLELASCSADSRLTPEQRARLEELVLRREGGVRLYAELLYQHAVLLWSAGQPATQTAGCLALQNTAQPQATVPAGTSQPATANQSLAVPLSTVRRWPWLTLRAAAIAAGLIAAAGLGLLRPSWTERSNEQTVAPTPPAVATLVAGQACKWEAAGVPTEFGARLTAGGRLRLAEGLARIVFDSGAEVSMEAPAELELLSQRGVVLHSGRLVARVPPTAIGFRVSTPTAELIDLGTEFGVSVAEARPDRPSDTAVQVFEGLVDAQHPGSGRVRRLRTGQGLRLSLEGTTEFVGGELSAATAGAASARPTPAPGTRWLTLTTAAGRGRDGFVQRGPRPGRSVPGLLLLKNSSGDDRDYSRKAYLAFDLRELADQPVLEAELTLSFSPTGLGFATELPECRFAVYGLRDNGADDWSPDTLTWATAPANRDGGADLDPDRVSLLGRFELPRGVQQGQFTLATSELTAFLNRDVNRLATLIVVRETVAVTRGDLVHGFASRQHSSLPPPTLRLVVRSAEP